MNDELRVTVIATGVGPVNKQQERPTPTIKVVPPKPVTEKPAKMGDYREFDKPTVTRLQTSKNDNSLNDHEDSNTQSGDYLDIPAFLRRQAD
ncbi:cell division protein FtsZ [Beggiatoa sp. PS]|nr:cell division protein FtsZ [Beggiatoa sp. PS]